ncbi:MAG: hypothetical protein HY704_10710 [Gemmatimonadetes bacterium]|nr:hypothetical protein [Gemmatimonadota bacterium]
MNEFLPFPWGIEGVTEAPASGTTTEPRLARETRRARWELAAARWRALELARLIFGVEARTRLGSAAAAGGFRGLLYLEVPFQDLDAHRARERLFVGHASSDDLLRRVSLVYVFAPLAMP